MESFDFNEKDKKVYDCICNAITKGNTEVILPKLYSQNMLMSIYKCTMGRKESIIYNPCIFSILSSTSQDKMLLEKLMLSRAEQKKFEQTIENIVSKIKKVAKEDVYERIKTTYLYFIHTITYGSKNFVLEEHSAWGALINKKAVCEGISYAFAMLLNAMSIPCITVHGQAMDCNLGVSETHAWNIVELNKKYYHVDVTWGLRNYSTVQLGEFDYFMLSDEEIKVNHSWKDYFIPECNSFQYNYFVLHDAYAVSKEHCRKIMCNQIKQTKTKIYIKLTNKLAQTLKETELVQMAQQLFLQINKEILCLQYSYNYNKELHIFNCQLLE